MIIELFGLPGVGKTTLSRVLAERNNFEVIKIKSRGELIFLNFVYLIKHPIKFFATLFYIIKNSDSWPLFYYKFTNCFLHHNAKYQKALKFEKTILDQGYFQNVLSIFEKPIDEKELIKYSKYLLKPTKLIILDLPFDELEKRAQERGYFSRDEYDEIYKLSWKNMLKKNYDLFKNSAGILNLNYLLINAVGDTEQIYQDILKTLD